MKALFLILILLVPACSSMEKLGDYFQDNPILSSILARQAIVRLIEKKVGVQSKKARAIRINAAINVAETYLTGTPTATIASLLEVVDASIDWGPMSRPDRLLVKDLILIVQGALSKGKDGQTLPPDTVISIRELLSVLRSATAFYM